MRPRRTTGASGVLTLILAACEITASLGSTASASGSSTDPVGSTGSSDTSTSTSDLTSTEATDPTSSASTSEGGSGNASGSTSSSSSAPASEDGSESELPFVCTPLADDPECRLCIRDACCPEVEACFAVPGCACTLFCLEDAHRPAPCDTLCVSSPESETALACVVATCAASCPL